MLMLYCALAGPVAAVANSVGMTIAAARSIVAGRRSMAVSPLIELRARPLGRKGVRRRSITPALAEPASDVLRLMGARAGRLGIYSFGISDWPAQFLACASLTRASRGEPRIRGA